MKKIVVEGLISHNTCHYWYRTAQKASL